MTGTTNFCSIFGAKFQIVYLCILFSLIFFSLIFSFFCWFLQVVEITGITCSVCFRQFSRKDSLKRHFVENHMEGRRLFNCDICQKVFKRKDHLNKHVKISHPNNE